MRRLTVWCATVSLGLFLAVAGPPARAVAGPPTRILVSAAASLKDALTNIGREFKRARPDLSVELNFGASGTLAVQIEQGAPVDVFVSASTEQMDELAAKNMLLAGTRVNLLQNRLVLIAPQGTSTVTSFGDLEHAQVRVVAMGDPRSVPAGAYAQQVLTALGIYDAVRRKTVLATDVRQVLAAVETGSADAGLVYATDAALSRRVRVVMEAPAGTHQPIVYPAAVLSASSRPDAARAFVLYLGSADAIAVFANYGFQPATR